MTKNSTLGTFGEDVAVKYLEGKRYRVLERNVRIGGGELDVVAMAPDKTLVLVEVKTMRPFAGAQDLRPEDQMTKAKMEKFKRAASVYAGAHQKLIDDRKGWRLDLVALVKEENGFRVRHYENI